MRRVLFFLCGVLMGFPAWAVDVEEHRTIASARRAYESGRHELAVRLLTRTLALEKKEKEPVVAVIARAHYDLGLNYRKLRELDKALEHHRESLRLDTQALGEEHSNIAYSRMALGLVLADKGESGKALGHFRAALAILQKAEANGGILADTRMNMGKALLASGKAVPAIAEFEQARALRGKLFGLEHPIMASTYAHIANAHMVAGAHGKAVQYLEPAMGILKKKLGAGHIHVAETHLSLAEARLGLKDSAGAMESLKQALAIHQKTLGAEHKATAAIAERIRMLAGRKR